MPLKLRPHYQLNSQSYDHLNHISILTMFGKPRTQMRTLIRLNMVFVKNKYNMNMVFIRDKHNMTTIKVTTNLLSKISLFVRAPSYTSTFTPTFLIGF